MVGILHLSDLHIGWRPKFLGALAEEREKERNDILRKAVDVALDSAHGIDMVIIAGDLFDSHCPAAPLAERTIRELERLQRAGKVVLTVPGNHDEITYRNSIYCQRESRWPGLLVREPNPSYLGELALGGEVVHLYGLAYTAGVTRCERPLSDLPRMDAKGIHIGVFHGSLDWNGGERSLPLCSHELARARYHYTALGHFHRASEHRVGDGLASYCGAPEARGMDDLGTGELQCVYISAEGRITGVKQVPLPVRTHRVEQLMLDDMGGIEELERAITSIANCNHVVRVVVTGSPSFQFDEQELHARLSHFFYHLELVDRTTSIPYGYVNELSKELSIRGVFVRRMLRAAEEATTPEEKSKYLSALRKGLRALQGVR